MQRSLFAFGFGPPSAVAAVDQQTPTKKRAQHFDTAESPEAKKLKSSPAPKESKYFSSPPKNSLAKFPEQKNPSRLAPAAIAKVQSVVKPTEEIIDFADDDLSPEALAELDRLEAEAMQSQTQTSLGTQPATQPTALDPTSRSTSTNSKPAPPKISRPPPKPPLVSAASPNKPAVIPLKRVSTLVSSSMSAQFNKYGFLDDIRDENGNRPGEPNYNPSTLQIPILYMQKMTAFEKQYWEIKKKNFDAVVFFNKGKFYELFERDADVGIAELGLQPSQRVSMKMVGIPKSAFDQYAGKLLAKGYKVARADQVETLLGAQQRKMTKGQRVKEDDVIRREVTRVLSAGTLVDPGLLSDHRAAPLLVISEWTGAHRAPCYAVCVLDAAEAEFSVGSFVDEPQRAHLKTLLLHVAPREIIFQQGNLTPHTLSLLRNYTGLASFPTVGSPPFWSVDETVQAINNLMEGQLPDLIAELNDGIEANEQIIRTVGGCLAYLQKLKVDSELLKIGTFVRYDAKGSPGRMILDGQTLQNLQVLENFAADTRGTLIGLLDHCVSPKGKRLLRRWLCHPLRGVEDIDARLDAVEFLIRESQHRDEIFGALKGLPDLERLTHRIRAQTVNLKQFVEAITGFQKLRDFFRGAHWMSECPVKLIRQMAYGEQFPDLDSALEVLSFDHAVALDTMRIEPSPGTDAEYDEALAKNNEVLEKLNEYVQSQRDLLQESRVQLQYASGGTARPVPQLEIPTTSKALTRLPSSYRQLQANKASKRYTTPELQAIESELGFTAERLEAAAQDVLRHFCSKFSDNSQLFLAAVLCAAQLDVLCSLAITSSMSGSQMCRPKLTPASNAFIRLAGMRHPCIQLENSAEFIPNDVSLGTENSPAAMLLLTGPNMGGKSTLLRQVCISVILAQIGCYVPADSCELSPADRIFTRIGAADDIMAGQSTFMVELNETSNVLRDATRDSLVILDELGRGTSTFDGYAIAYAVLHHLISAVGCRVLFSTHYHMLTEEFHQNPRVLLGHMACKVDDNKREVLFLYKLRQGVCPKSYGMNVAAMAGIPREVIQQAEEMAHKFESESLLGAVSRFRRVERAVAQVLAEAKQVAAPAIKEKLRSIQQLLAKK